MREEVKKEFKLPNEKVVVRLVNRQRGAISDPNHELYNCAPGSETEFCPMNKKGELTIDCPLTTSEIEYFEDKRKSGMAFDIGDLSPHAEASVNFWRSRKATVRLGRHPIELDLSDPSDYLKYKILLSNKDTIAPNSESEKFKGSYIYVIESKADMHKVKLEKGSAIKRAWKLAGKMDSDRDAMINYLSVVGKRPAANAKLDWLESEINNQVETNRKEFLEVLESDNYAARVLLARGMQVKAIKKEGNSYRLADGTLLVEQGEVPTLNNTLSFLHNDDNQDIAMIIEAKINN